MKDIGSIFPLYDSDLQTKSVDTGLAADNDRIYYSLCREALYAIAEILSGTNKKVLLPAYTCDTVITPFKELGWECCYFSLGKNLRINSESVREQYKQHQVSLMVVHPYYGMDLNQEEQALLKELHDQGCKIVVDVTQGIYTTQELEYVDYYVGSYRKWFNVPDGAFLKSRNGLSTIQQPQVENADFVSMQTDAMHLRGAYFQSQNQSIKDRSIQLNKKAESFIDHHIAPHKMSVFSYSIFKGKKAEECQKPRLANYGFLYEKLSSVKGIELVCGDMREVQTAPLYFPLYTHDRKALQVALAEEHVYAPVIWPVVYDEVIIDDTIRYIYDSLLAIPIDQRYNQEDMAKIVEIINRHYHD